MSETEAQKRARKDKELAVLAFKDFSQAEGGKIWLRNMLKSSMVMMDTFTGNSTTFFQEGKRAVGLAIAKDLAEASPDVYAEIMKEII